LIDSRWLELGVRGESEAREQPDFITTRDIMSHSQR